VNERQNPLFYRLISQFAKITGVPMVLNTSFNRHGVPIVATPRQAIEHLLEGSVDLLAIEGYLVSPLIGTRDSARTQVVMESLLKAIVDTNSETAILDITGVPTVDTLVAQHLMRTVTAIRLMGADCIISGIRPQIAQTIVHLGVDLTDISTKATLADALSLALKRGGFVVTRRSAS
jgi:rsbT co-antagonist protein RsbR